MIYHKFDFLLVGFTLESFANTIKDHHGNLIKLFKNYCDLVLL